MGLGPEGKVFEAKKTEFPDGVVAPLRAASDLKAGRRGLKAPLHWVPMWALLGVSRVFAYGAVKYLPGNWVKAAQEKEPERALEDYLSAAQRHWAAIQEADEGGIACWDKRDPESGLPHLDHLLCSLIMLRGIGQKAGLLPQDPGKGKEPQKRTGL